MNGIPATIDIKVPPGASRFQVTLDEFGVCDRQEKGLAVVTIFNNDTPAWGPMGPFGSTEPTPVEFPVKEGDRIKLEVSSRGDGGCDDQVWRSARFSPTL